MAWRCIVSHQPDTFVSIVSRHDRSALRSSRGKRPEAAGVGHQVDLVGVAHADEVAVEVDLDGPGLVELRHELGVGEVRPHGEQGVAVHHQLIAAAGSRAGRSSRSPRQLVGEHIFAQQGLGHPGPQTSATC